ncbi:MAG: hypothetical protein IJK20_00570 [Bacteroidales bacterium]|nr:hypothetical protein [Bacteroidales bacterium]
MKRIFTPLLMAVAALALASCNNPAKMAEAADQIQITCTPEVLEVVAGEIKAEVMVTFPADYFQPKYTLTLTPVIVYEGGEAVGKPFVYQGEKIADNFKTVSKKGATIRENVRFDYVPGMEKCRLVARAKVNDGKKDYTYPADIRIADGANTTYMLAGDACYFKLAKDEYEEINSETAEAQILYLVNSAEVRQSQIRSNDMEDFVDIIGQMTSDPRSKVKGTQIIAYASPEGDVKHNNDLSSNREKSAKQAFDKLTKKVNTGEVETRSIGEDWEGFQELVRNSSIEDRDLILRVLSMYSDPNVREREIRNLSSVYKSLANSILPELRRARFITTVEYANYTEAELRDLLENNITELDEEALLRVATLVKDDARYAAYDQAIKKYNSDRAKYNAACISLKGRDEARARKYIDKMKEKGTPEVKNLLGVIALREKNLDEAQRLFKEAGDVAKANLGIAELQKGNYKAAAANLKGTKCVEEAVAMVLSGDLDGCLKMLEGHDCAKSDYIRAVIAARQGRNDEAKALIEKASRNKELAERAAKDVEFAKIR